jgi:lactate dehydrogenase-like 2-hydroxyacid dehydrogenase
MPDSIDVLLTGSLRQDALQRLHSTFSVEVLEAGTELSDLPQDRLARIRGVAACGGGAGANSAMIAALPNLEIIASFGVGYDGVAVEAAAERGIIVTNTPDVLTEEVADTALGLLLMTARQLSSAERYLRAGSWASDGDIAPIPTTLRDRTVGIAGMGRIGIAVARRLEAMQIPVVYHNRSPREGVANRYYANLADMARDVDTLICIMPGGDATRNLIDAGILSALGANGVLINVGRGSSVDEDALIKALSDGTICAAGLDVFATEPNVPAGLLALDNAVLLPHVGSNTAFTRNAMANLVVENLASWFSQGSPVTPVAETPWPRK